MDGRDPIRIDLSSLPRLGKGVVGRVYQLNSTQVIKVPHSQNYNPDLTYEYELSQYIDPKCPQSIVQVYDLIKFIDVEGYPHLGLVEEYIPGLTVSDWIGQGMPYPIDPMTVSRLLLEGLDCFHRVGFSHGDMHPGNIILREDGIPKYIDLGSGYIIPEDASVNDRQIYINRDLSILGELLHTLIGSGHLDHKFDPHLDRYPQLKKVIVGIWDDKIKSAQEALEILNS